MRKSAYATLAAIVIAAAPFAGTAMAGQTDMSGVRMAQSSGQVPEKCAQLQNAQARAECIKQESGSQ
jgi:hypothetical protein